MAVVQAHPFGSHVVGMFDLAKIISRRGLCSLNWEQLVGMVTHRCCSTCESNPPDVRTLND